MYLRVCFPNVGHLVADFSALGLIVSGIFAVGLLVADFSTG